MKEVKSNFNGFKTNIEVQRVSDRADTVGIGDSAVPEGQTPEVQEDLFKLEYDQAMKAFGQWFMVVLAKAKTFDNVYESYSATKDTLGNVRLSISCYLQAMDEGVQHYESLLT